MAVIFLNVAMLFVCEVQWARGTSESLGSWGIQRRSFSRGRYIASNSEASVNKVLESVFKVGDILPQGTDPQFEWRN
jgi:hypothetical protein